MKTNYPYCRTITAIERDGFNVRTLTIVLGLSDQNLDIVSAVKNACLEFAKTPEGRAIYVGNCDSFNWADFEAYVPNEICEKHGFRKLDVTQLSDTAVNWDEQLVDEDEMMEEEDGEMAEEDGNG